ncbi:MAG TPA: hypothetical protein VGQ36_22710 [Thermoanaerobaculia bacterium]|jgi:hypothetical protein|nr:hypothetical protein [Thermoanaerobaculia bacterium]
MVRNGRKSRIVALVAVAVMVTAMPLVAQAKGILSGGAGANSPYFHDPTQPEGCRGAINFVQDIGFEGVKTTTHNFSNATGGGESNRFDKTPVLTTKVELREGCLNAHFSAVTGSAQAYGTSPITFYQVTLTPTDGSAGPQHMYGHYETPYGIYGPAVFIEAETDVDEIGANFFQRIGDGPTDVKPGVYYVDVWWAGGPAGAGGAIGAAFVLKLYQQQ